MVMPAFPQDRERFIAASLHSHTDALRRFVASRVPAVEVDDILQLAAVRALEGAATLDNTASVRAWMFTIHRNVVTDTLRKLQRRDRLRDALQIEPTLPDPDASPCACSRVQAARLQPTYAEVLALVDTGDSSISEAADILGISATNTRVRLHRARKALRHAMREHCGVEDADECMVCRCIEDECCVI